MGAQRCRVVCCVDDGGMDCVGDFCAVGVGDNGCGFSSGGVNLQGGDESSGFSSCVGDEESMLCGVRGVLCRRWR